MATYDENERKRREAGIGGVQPTFLKRLFKNTPLDLTGRAAPARSVDSVNVFDTGDGAPNFPNAPLPTMAPARPAVIPSAAPARAAIAGAVVPGALGAVPRPAFGNVVGGGAFAPNLMATTAPGTAVINGRDVSGLIPTRPGARPVATPPTAPGVAYSEATGGQALPPGAGMTVQRPVLNGQANPSEAQRMAESEASALLSGDWRSATGLAARNARVDAASQPSSIGTTRRQREQVRGGRIAAVEDAIGQQAGAALARPAELAAAEAANVRERGDTQRALISADASVEQARLQRPRNPMQTITNEDGTLAQITEQGVAQPIVDANGNVVRPQRGKPAVDSTAFAKIFETNRAALLGADPITGLINDPANPGVQRPPTPQELQNATIAAREQTMLALEGGGATAASKPTKAQFLQQARASNPGVSDAELEAYYASNYGG